MPLSMPGQVIGLSGYNRSTEQSIAHRNLHPPNLLVKKVELLAHPPWRKHSVTFPKPLGQLSDSLDTETRSDRLLSSDG